MSEIPIGTKIKDRYTLVEYKGSGSFGEVWLAHDDFLDSDVAIKIYISLDPRGVEEFKSEYKTTLGISHPNLLPTTHFDVWQQRPFLVMKYCAKGSSSKLVGNTNEYTIWEFVHDVAAGLKYLHGGVEPIIHQDIKPDNILVDDNNRFVISDFGISKKIRSTMRKQSKRAVGAGATAYMGPERFDSDPTPVKASDIWSLGVSIYELATGELPFSGMGGGMQKNGAEMPSLDNKWSKELNMVMQSCLSKETWDRPTADQLERYSEDILAGKPAKATWKVAEPSPGDVSEYPESGEQNQTEETEEKIYWDENQPDRLDLDYYDNLRKLAKTILWGGILTVILSIIGTLYGQSKGTLTAVEVVTSLIESVVYCVIAIICYKAILKRKPSALFLSRGFLIFCMLSWILYVCVGGSILLSAIVIIWGIWGIIMTCTSEDAKTVFPKHFRKTTARDYLIVLALFIVPVALGIFYGSEENDRNPETQAEKVENEPGDSGTIIETTKGPEVEKTETEAKVKKETTKPELKEKTAPKKESAPEKNSADNKAQQLKDALASGDYEEVQKLANSGYAAAYGPLARYYLRNNDYETAETYARKAKAAGYSDGTAVIATLQNLGYYD